MLDLNPVGYILALWFLGLLIIFLIGFILNKLTSKQIKQYQIQSTDQNDSNERLLLQAYFVLWILASIYFYISLPMLIVALGALIIIFLFYIWPLAVITAIVGIFSLLSLVFSIFRKAEAPYLGQEVKREDAPRLWAFMDSTSSQVNSKQVDAVYITPWQQIMIIEQGTIWNKIRGKSQHNLSLGLGIATGLHQDRFRTILVALLNLLSNRNVNSLLALHLQAAVYKSINQLAPRTSIQWLNPISLFMQVFHLFFLRTNSIATRMEQILNDHFAATIYGLTNVIDALIELETQEIYFKMKVVDELNRAYLQSDKIDNVYRLLSSPTTKQKEKITEELTKRFRSPDFPYRNLQTLLDRLDLLEKGSDLESHQPLVSDLIPEFEELQVKMSKIIQAQAF